MKGNVHAGVGAGRYRKPYRIREFLDALGTNMAQVAHELNLSRQIVQATVRGQRNNRRVLGYLKELGCPDVYLSLPDEMQKTSAR